MFTGIITALGEITDVTPLGSSREHGLRVRVQTPPEFLRGAVIGESIALSGACMTVTQFDTAEHWFAVEVSAESLRNTCALDRLGWVNLERALKLGDALGGHIVSGHVDAVGALLSAEAVGESQRLCLRVPKDFMPYLASKGSVAVDGVSLTVNAVDDASQSFAVNCIALTQQQTTLGRKQPGDAVNLEADMLSRYVQRQWRLHAAQ